MATGGAVDPRPLPALAHESPPTRRDHHRSDLGVDFAGLIRLLPGLHNPFSERDVDRSQPVILQSIQDLSRYEAAAGNFQVVIDLEKDARFLPSVVRGQRTLFVAAGAVGA